MAELGVPINLSKSVVAEAKPVTEFAKVTTHSGSNVSALSWKMFISHNSLMGRVNILYNLVVKKYLPSHHLGQWLMDVTCKNRFKEGKKNFIFYPLLSMLTSNGVLSYEDLVRSLYTKDIKNSNNKKALVLGVNSQYLQNLIIS
jgi:hypothetical protein